MIGGPCPRHPPHDGTKHLKSFNAVAWVAQSMSWKSGRIQDATDLATLLCGESIFFSIDLEKTTYIRLKDSEEEILHKDTLISNRDQTFKLTKFGITFGHPFVRLLTGTVTSYSEILEASPKNC